MSMAAFAQDPDVENGKRSFHPEIQAGPEYDFRKTTWGMSIDEVKASEEKKPDDERFLKDMEEFSYSLSYIDVIFVNYNCQLMYLFDEGKLTTAELFFLKEPKSPNAEQLKQALESKFGTPQYDNVSEEQDIHFLGWSFENSKMVLMEYLSGRPNAIGSITFVPVERIKDF